MKESMKKFSWKSFGKKIKNHILKEIQQKIFIKIFGEISEGILNIISKGISGGFY